MPIPERGSSGLKGWHGTEQVQRAAAFSSSLGHLPPHTLSWNKHLTHWPDLFFHITTTCKISGVYKPHRQGQAIVSQGGGGEKSCRKHVAWMLRYLLQNSWLVHRCSLLAHKWGCGLAKKKKMHWKYVQIWLLLLFPTESHSLNVFSSHPLLVKWQTKNSNGKSQK